MTAVAPGRSAASTFDRAQWPPARPRLAAAAVLLGFAAATWAVGGLGRLAAVLLVADVAVQLLPWRTPRSGRSAASIWTESLLHLALPAVLLAAAVGTGQPWVTDLPHPLWFAAAPAVGAGLVLAGGMPLRALLTGDLAFFAAPVSRRHKRVRCLSVAAAPPGEEALFRGPVLLAAGPAAVPLGLLAGAAFVARHHLPPGLHDRTTRRVLATRVVAAAALTGLACAAQSILPALLAHAVANAPSFLLELQRPTQDGV